jgi:hypothetical protein
MQITSWKEGISLSIFILDVLKELVEAFSFAFKSFLADLSDHRRIDLGMFPPCVFKQSLNSLHWGESKGNIRFLFGCGESLTFFLTCTEQACDTPSVVHSN